MIAHRLVGRLLMITPLTLLALAPVAVTAAPPTPTITLTSSLNPSTAGQSVTFTATVTSTIPPSTSATTVYGQAGSFSTANCNGGGGATAQTLCNPHNTVVDSAGDVYVSDDGNNRVLYFPKGSTTATRVYGQFGDFTGTACNNRGVSADSLCRPHGLALDKSGNLYVADANNNRVLFYPAGSTTATQIWGNGGDFTTQSCNSAVASPSTLCYALGIAVDGTGNLYVADRNYSRVVMFPAGSGCTGINTPSGCGVAAKVWGQNGDFTAVSFNTGGLSATSLAGPEGLGIDAKGDLLVPDTFNNRVLFYPAGGGCTAPNTPVGCSTATLVWGQGGSFTTGGVNTGGLSATSIGHPNSVVADASGNLYVSDGGNNRLLYFLAGSGCTAVNSPSGCGTATQVWGQAGSFATNTVNNGGVSATSLDYPHGLSLDSTGDLFTADHNNSRVLEYGAVKPSGTVTFRNGSTPLATIALTGDPTASYSTSTLPVGTQSVTAVYNGDSNFASVTSSVLAQVVVGIPVPTTGAVEAGGIWPGNPASGISLIGAGVAALAGRRVRRRST